MKVTENIEVKELVPQSVYYDLGVDKCMELINVDLAKAIQACRDYFNSPAIINNWHIGGNYQYRGYRPQDCKVGAKNSEHKKSNAYDFHIIGIPSETVRDYIRKNYQSIFKPLGITRIEAGVNWVHIDGKNTGKDYLVEFSA